MLESLALCHSCSNKILIYTSKIREKWVILNTDFL